jgi:hypothetical protein
MQMTKELIDIYLQISEFCNEEIKSKEESKVTFLENISS